MRFSLYKVTVLNFGNMTAVMTPDWTFNAAGLLTGLIAAGVQVDFSSIAPNDGDTMQTLSFTELFRISHSYTLAEMAHHCGAMDWVISYRRVRNGNFDMPIRDGPFP